MKRQKIETAYTTFSNQILQGEQNCHHDLVTVWGCTNAPTQKMYKAQVGAKGTKINWKPKTAEKNFK